jgi:transposase
MSHNIAGIDVHKKLLVVVLADAAQPDVPLQARRFGTGAGELRHLSAWLSQYQVMEAVMESTAQYWKPVWMELEPNMKLHLAQAQSNKAPKGRKSDLADAKRRLRRFVAGGGADQVVFGHYGSGRGQRAAHTAQNGGR